MKIILLGLVLLALVLTAMTYLWHPRAGLTLGDLEAAELCRQRYLLARTAAESVGVDGHRPILGRGQAEGALTCKALRQVSERR